jgi:plastocyanin
MNRKERYLAVMMLLAAAGTAIRAAAVSMTTRADQAAQKSEVKIDNFSFAPGEITVSKGTTVNWVNRDDIPHTVVSDDKSTFKSKPLDTDEHFSYTFSKEGTYSYFCSIHPKMTAKVVVK